MTISPGWYKDPAEPATQRYWDGDGWVGAPLPVDVTPPEGPPPADVLPPVTKTIESPTAPVQKLPPGYPPPLAAPARPHGMVLATLGARTVARIIDISVVALLNVVVNGWFVYKWLQDSIPYTQAVFKAFQSGQPIGEIARPAQMDNLLLVISLLAMALWFAYEVPATAHSGQTLGKRAARIKVVRVESQEPLGFLRSTRRWIPLGAPLSLFWFCGAFLMILQFTDIFFAVVDRTHRMALHDRSAGTYVVQLPTPAPSVPKGQ